MSSDIFCAIIKCTPSIAASTVGTSSVIYFSASAFKESIVVLGNNANIDRGSNP